MVRTVRRAVGLETYVGSVTGTGSHIVRVGVSDEIGLDDEGCRERRRHGVLER